MPGGPAQPSGTLTKAGDGTFTYSGGFQGSYGSLVLKGGVLSVLKGDEFPANGITFDGGTFRITAGSVNASNPITVNAGNGTFNSNLDQTFTGPITGPGTLHKTGSGNLSTNGVSLGGLSVDNGVFTVASGRSAAKTSTVGNLTVGASAKIDLGDNDVIYNYTGGASATRLADVRTQLIAGYNGGAWNGANGITSSVAQANASTSHPTALGYAEASTTGLLSFDGVNTDADMILIRYTSGGDANLDGTVGTGDFMLLAQNFNKSSNVNWVNGDFNYDGVVNALDFNQLATNFGQTVAAPAVLGTLVPEPGALSMLAGALAILARRRTRARRERRR